jgi:hypothetical protein
VSANDVSAAAADESPVDDGRASTPPPPPVPSTFGDGPTMLVPSGSINLAAALGGKGAAGGELNLHELDEVTKQRHMRTQAFLAAISGLPVPGPLAPSGLTATGGDRDSEQPTATATGPAPATTIAEPAKAIADATAVHRRPRSRPVIMAGAATSAAVDDTGHLCVNEDLQVRDAADDKATTVLEDLAEWTTAELVARSTSLSCRNYFRSRDMQPESSSSSASCSSVGRAKSTGNDTKSDSNARSTASRGSEDLRACADGVPRTAKQLAGLVRKGRTLPIRFTTERGQTVGWTTLITKYGDEGGQGGAGASGTGVAHDDDGTLDIAGRADLLLYVSWMNVFKSPALLKEIISSKRKGQKEARYKTLVERVRPKSAVELDPYFFDDPSITGEQRLKRMNLSSYCTSVIVFADKDTVRNEVDQRFFLKHPDCERRGVRLSTIRRVKALLIQVALDHGSPIDLATVVHAVCYFERLIVSTFVTGENKGHVASVCMLLATKFYESGISKRSEMNRKIQYSVGKMEDAFGIDARTIFAWELRVLVALEFDLMVPEQAGLAYLVALLNTRNITPLAHFGTANKDSDSEGSDSSSDAD